MPCQRGNTNPGATVWHETCNIIGMNRLSEDDAVFFDPKMKFTLSSFARFADIMPDTIVVVDGAGRIVCANPAIESLLGYSAEEVVGEPLGCLIPQAYRAAHERHFAQFRERTIPTAMGARPLLAALHKSGVEAPISISIANLEFEEGRYSVAVMRDVGALQTEITAANALAETDTLTGIGSRLRLSRVMQAAIAEGLPFGLLFLDLRQFKPFNDNHGHEIGDRVLQIVARRIESDIRAADLAARFGGDEFVVLLSGLDRKSLLEQRACSICRGLTRPFHIRDMSGSIGVSIGGAIYPRDGQTAAALLEVADRNMYRARKLGIDYHF